MAPSTGSRFLDQGHERLELGIGRQPVDPAGVRLVLQERSQPVDELGRRQASDPLAVQPFEAFAVEDRRRPSGRDPG